MLPPDCVISVSSKTKKAVPLGLLENHSFSWVNLNSKDFLLKPDAFKPAHSICQVWWFPSNLHLCSIHPNAAILSTHSSRYWGPFGSHLLLPLYLCSPWNAFFILSVCTLSRLFSSWHIAFPAAYCRLHTFLCSFSDLVLLVSLSLLDHFNTKRTTRASAWILTAPVDTSLEFWFWWQHGNHNVESLQRHLHEHTRTLLFYLNALFTKVQGPLPTLGILSTLDIQCMLLSYSSDSWLHFASFVFKSIS